MGAQTITSPKSAAIYRLLPDGQGASFAILSKFPLQHESGGNAATFSIPPKEAHHVWFCPSRCISPPRVPATQNSQKWLFCTFWGQGLRKQHARLETLFTSRLSLLNMLPPDPAEVSETRHFVVHSPKHRFNGCLFRRWSTCVQCGFSVSWIDFSSLRESYFGRYGYRLQMKFFFPSRMFEIPNDFQTRSDKLCLLM